MLVGNWNTKGLYGAIDKKTDGKSLFGLDYTGFWNEMSWVTFTY